MNKTSASNTPRKVSLTEKVIASLRSEIESGQREPGSKLPTEPVLTERFGVSRTVIREAIAALKADGLLEPRQGAGVFVLAPETRSNDKSIFEVDYAQVSDVLEILELRMAVEIEAAGLACMRSSVAQQAKIFEAMEKMERALEKGNPPPRPISNSTARLPRPPITAAMPNFSNIWATRPSRGRSFAAARQRPKTRNPICR